MNSKLEQDFKKVTGYCYSEEGHNYQLTYSANAAKHSTGVVFFKVNDSCYAFKRYNGFMDTGIQVFKDSCCFLTRGVFTYAYGHKINLPIFKRYLGQALIERDYAIGCLYTPKLAPGLSNYVKSKCLNFNSSYSIENKMTSGLTTFHLICSTKTEPSASLLIYPNGKIKYGRILYEGHVKEEEVIDLVNLITNKKYKITEIERMPEIDICNEIEIFLNDDNHRSELKGWQVFKLDPHLSTVELV